MPKPKNLSECVVEDCQNLFYCKGMCSLHYYRQYNGLPLEGRERVYASKDDNVGYRAAHTRVERKRGKARIYFCVECVDQAAEWSLKHDAPDTVVSTAINSMGKEYSLDVFAYEPRCIKHHRSYDGNNPPYRLSPNGAGV